MNQPALSPSLFLSVRLVTVGGLSFAGEAAATPSRAYFAIPSLRSTGNKHILDGPSPLKLQPAVRYSFNCT